MIRTDDERDEALKRLHEESTVIDQHRKELSEQGLTDEQLSRLIEPLECFHLQLKEEVVAYDKLKAGDFSDFRDVRDMGRLLIALRIKRGFSQADLAAKLGGSPSSVCRDERNEYHGISVERYDRILEALGATVELCNISLPLKDEINVAPLYLKKEQQWHIVEPHWTVEHSVSNCPNDNNPLGIAA